MTLWEGDWSSKISAFQATQPRKLIRKIYHLLTYLVKWEAQTAQAEQVQEALFPFPSDYL